MSSTIISGQVVHRRNVSRRMAFFDLEDQVSLENKRISVLFKTQICGQDIVDKAKSGKDKIHTGDIVQVHGDLDDEGILLVKSFSVIEHWTSTHPNESFQPKPPTTEMSKIKENEGICKFWLNSGQCPKEEKCQFKHEVTDFQAAKQEMLKTKLEFRLSLQDGDHATFVSRHARSRIFAKWIFDKFAKNFKNEKVIILDIAGGKGDLSFEMSVEFDLKCIVVDPRDVGYTVRPKFQRKRLKTSKNNAELTDLYDCISDVFNRDFFQTRANLLKTTALVVGLHPDQATEAIIDMAVVFDFPFAVIPCCVFAHENPDRRLKNGQEPKTYEAFCDYLLEKDENISSENLNFRGRNRVLFKV